MRICDHCESKNVVKTVALPTNADRLSPTDYESRTVDLCKKCRGEFVDHCSKIGRRKDETI